MNETTATASVLTDALDTLRWDDWDTLACSIENGAECTACEG